MAKQIIGTVSSAKGDKTIVVSVHTHKTHPLYRKRYLVTKKFMAHDEKNEAQVGDKVAITETRPLSARKRHTLSRIVEKPKLREDSLTATKAEEASTSSRAGKKSDGKAEAKGAGEATE